MFDFPTVISIVLLYVCIFLYGVVIGSFLNVVICRLPRKESIVKIRSHCEACGYQLKWYDLIPLFSYLFLGGKCRKCKAQISVQHPIVEALNGVLYVMLFYRYGLSLTTIVYCLTCSALLALSVIDFRTYEIPVGFQYVIGAFALVHLFLDRLNWSEYVIGFFSVSIFLLVLYCVSKGRAIGGGDVKLMAVCGLLLGWKLIIVAFVWGCIIGSVVHILRMKLSGESRVLAMGPYLSIGVFLAMMWGERFLSWYFGMFGI